MKSKLITLSIVSLLVSNAAQAQNSPLPPSLKDPALPGQNVLPAPPDQINKTHPIDADQLEVPDELKQHRQEFEKVKIEGTDFEESKLLDDESIDKKWRKYMKEGNESYKEGNFSAAASKYKRALSYAEKASEKSELLQAITNKHLGQSYIDRERYEEARDFLKSAREMFLQLGMKNDGISPLVEKISQFYKELDFRKFGEKVSKYFEDAKVERIRVFKEQDLTKFKVELASKFIREVESDKVKKVKFNKFVSFDFRSLPDEHYGLENVQGLQVRTKKLWVNLLSSFVGLNQQNQPEAKITGGKLGKEKTVVVKVPGNLYDQGKSILEEFKKAISSTKYDADLVSKKEEEEKVSQESDQTQTSSEEAPAGAADSGSETADSASEAVDSGSEAAKKPAAIKEMEEKKDIKPPEVINAIDEPVQPEQINPVKQYDKVIDSDLNEEKPPVRIR